MIHSLTVENFRQFKNLELNFSENEKLIVLEGPNGSGKTTVLEAICYALYGITRYGSTHGAADMLRRNSKNPLKVTLTLDINKVKYTVERSLFKQSKAQIFDAQGKELVKGARECTQYITQLFGLSYKNFLYSTVAQQKELSGLVDLLPSKRAEVVSKTLRIDSVEKSSIAAREKYVSLVKELQENRKNHVEPELYAKEIKNDRKKIKSLEKSIKKIEKNLESLKQEKSLLDSSAKEFLKRAKVEGAAAGRREFVLGRLALVVDSLDNLIIPPYRTPVDVDAALARVDGAKAALVRFSVREENRLALQEVSGEVERLKTILPSPQDPGRVAKEVTAISLKISNMKESYTSLLKTSSEFSAQVLALDSQLDAMLVSLETLKCSVGQCGACGQDLLPEMLDERKTLLENQVEVLRTERLDAIQGRDTASSQSQVVSDKLENSTQDLLDLERDLISIQHQSKKREEILLELKRQTQKMSRLESLSFKNDDSLKQLQEFKKMALDDYNTAKRIEEDNASRVLLLESKGKLTAEKNDLEKELKNLPEGSSSDLSKAFDLSQKISFKIQELESSTALQVEYRDSLNTSMVVKLDSFKKSKKQEAILNKVKSQALKWAMVSSALSVLAQNMHAESRVFLNVEVSNILSMFSSGNFTSLEVDKDYNIIVQDSQGVWQPIRSLSGGEQDLVALALRTGLSILATRGGAAPGFIILDEIFGYQDVTRRAQIKETLEVVKALFGQVFLISHVGDISTGADRVVSFGNI